MKPYDRRLIWKVRGMLPNLRLEEGWDERTPYEKQEILQTTLRAVFEENGWMRGLLIDVVYLRIATPDEGELIEVHVYDPPPPS